VQWDEVHAGGSYLSSNDPRLHYGLGKRNKVDLIELHWPDGKVEAIRDVPANKFVTIEEEKGMTRASLPTLKK
jgi:enediyne biosynthesis protein E4